MRSGRLFSGDKGGSRHPRNKIKMAVCPAGHTACDVVARWARRHNQKKQASNLHLRGGYAGAACLGAINCAKWSSDAWMADKRGYKPNAGAGGSVRLVNAFSCCGVRLLVVDIILQRRLRSIPQEVTGEISVARRFLESVAPLLQASSLNSVCR